MAKRPVSMRRIAVINQKGGVGKTTTCANLGAALARLGRRVVLVDMDAQANLAMHLACEVGADQPSTYSVLTGKSAFADALRDTATPDLRLLPSHIELSGAELELASTFGRETLMRVAIEDWIEAARRSGAGLPADYLIFDCPPSLGLPSINALAASGEVLIAMQTEFFALQGLSTLVEVIDLIRRRIHPGIEITGILPCLYDARLKLAREVIAEVRTYFPGKVFRTAIRANVKLAESPSFGQTIFEYAPSSPGASDYRRVAEEVVEQERYHGELAQLPRAAWQGAEPARQEAEPASQDDAPGQPACDPADPQEPVVELRPLSPPLPRQPPAPAERPRLPAPRSQEQLASPVEGWVRDTMAAGPSTRPTPRPSPSPREGEETSPAEATREAPGPPPRPVSYASAGPRQPVRGHAPDEVVAARAGPARSRPNDLMSLCLRSLRSIWG